MNAIDPVCGMEVDVDEQALSEELGDDVFYFCCEGCREQFLEDPEQYADVAEALAVVPES
jgi:Cu+-exporting ATPase